jgi:hypothetical protein
MDAKFNLDTFGFLSQECPSCDRRFKVRPTKSSEPDAPKKTLAHCPYCDHDGEQCWWWTPEQAKYIQAIGLRYVAERMNEGMRARGSKAWKPGPMPIVPPPPAESDADCPSTTEFTCCSETIRHDASVAKLRCIICGTRQPQLDAERLHPAQPVG